MQIKLIPLALSGLLAFGVTAVASAQDTPPPPPDQTQAGPPAGRPRHAYGPRSATRASDQRPEPDHRPAEPDQAVARRSPAEDAGTHAEPISFAGRPPRPGAHDLPGNQQQHQGSPDGRTEAEIRRHAGTTCAAEAQRRTAASSQRLKSPTPELSGREAPGPKPRRFSPCNPRLKNLVARDERQPAYFAALSMNPARSFFSW